MIKSISYMREVIGDDETMDAVLEQSEKNQFLSQIKLGAFKMGDNPYEVEDVDNNGTIVDSEAPSQFYGTNKKSVEMMASMKSSATTATVFTA